MHPVAVPTPKTDKMATQDASLKEWRHQFGPSHHHSTCRGLEF